MVPERPYTFNLEGDLGAFDAARVQALFPPPSDYTRIVIDCSAVTSMDSSIIAALMLFRQSFALAGRNPLDVVVIASPRIRKVLDLTGVVRFLTVVYR
jgi:anti-anti-sigma regulatory factor